MKVSNKKIVTLFIFVIFILIESVFFITYETKAHDNIEEMLTEEAIMTDEEKETLDLINEYRRQNGLSELKTFSKLQEVAKLKAEDIVNNNYFSHTSENLGTPFEMLNANGVDYRIAGENLAGNISPKRAVEAWINSPSHKENILEEEFEYSAICVVDSQVYGKVFVELFIGI